MIDRILRTGACAMIAAAAVMVAVPGAIADGAQMLAAYEGDWRGDGEARPNPQSKPTRVSCKISAVFDPSTSALSNTGRCGTTQGARKLEGTLVAKGDALSGDLFGNAATPAGVTNQKLRIADGMIVSEGQIETSGKVTRLRTFLTAPKDGAFTMQSQFYDWGTKDWIVAGEIEFRKE